VAPLLGQIQSHITTDGQSVCLGAESTLELVTSNVDISHFLTLQLFTSQTLKWSLRLMWTVQTFYCLTYHSITCNHHKLRFTEIPLLLKFYFIMIFTLT
jgi:hypothetical protein